MQKFKYTIDGKAYEVQIEDSSSEETIVDVNGKKFTVKREVVATPPKAKAEKKLEQPNTAPTTAPKAAPKVSVTPPTPTKTGTSAAGHPIKSPLPGVILDINCAAGDTVKKGQKLLVLEAMKMENDIKADRDGTVASVNVNKGDSVQEGADLVTIA